MKNKGTPFSRLPALRPEDARGRVLYWLMGSREQYPELAELLPTTAEATIELTYAQLAWITEAVRRNARQM